MKYIVPCLVIFLDHTNVPNFITNFIISKGLISQKWGVQTPPPPLASQSQNLAYPPPPHHALVVFSFKV